MLRAVALAAGALLPLAVHAQFAVGPGGCLAENFTLSPCDYAVALQQGAALTSLWSNGAFEQTETNFARWCAGTDRFPDGTWKLRAFEEGFFNYFLRSEHPRDDRELIVHWGEVRPRRLVMGIVEVAYWRARAQSVIQSGGASSAEGRQLIESRLVKARERLMAFEDLASSCPAWSESLLRVELDQHRPIEEVEASFRLAVQQFPGYQEPYLLAARALVSGAGAPSQDDLRALDQFARQATRTAPDEGQGMYARIYAATDRLCGCQGAEFTADGTPDWPTLRRGFEDLLRRYPQSLATRNHFASFACRARDRDTYLRERAIVGTFADPAAWLSPFTLPECDRRYYTLRQ